MDSKTIVPMKEEGIAPCHGLGATPPDGGSEVAPNEGLAMGVVVAVVPEDVRDNGLDLLALKVEDNRSACIMMQVHKNALGRSRRRTSDWEGG